MAEIKKCTKCLIDRYSYDFSKDKSKKDGLYSSCNFCRKNYQKQFYIKNKEKENIRIKKYRDNNVGWYNEYIKEYRKNNKDKIKEYRQNNKEKLNSNQNKYYKNKRKNDSLFVLSHSIRGLISNSFKYNNHIKNSKTQQILGCTFEEFKQYIESKFESWMNWDNKGLYNGELNYGWDIDHIIPLSSAKTEDDLMGLNHYTNLQPLCSKINRDIKRNKI